MDFSSRTYDSFNLIVAPNQWVNVIVTCSLIEINTVSVEGLTIPEIADRMERSPATVKRRLQDGEVLLSARLERPLPNSSRGGTS